MMNLLGRLGAEASERPFYLPKRPEKRGGSESDSARTQEYMKALFD